MGRRLPSLPLILLLLAAIMMSYQVAFVAKSLARVEIVVHYVPEDKQEDFHIPEEKPLISYDSAVSAVVQEFESDKWDPLGLRADAGENDKYQEEESSLAEASRTEARGALAKESVAPAPVENSAALVAETSVALVAERSVAPVAETSVAPVAKAAVTAEAAGASTSAETAREAHQQGTSRPSNVASDGAATSTLPGSCHARPYTEIWGDAVMWAVAAAEAIGAGNASPHSCCELCSRTPRCNAWVQCTNASVCQQQCWLKAIPDPLKPPISSAWPGVTPWMSGTIWPGGGQGGDADADTKQAAPALSADGGGTKDDGVARRPFTNRLKLTTSTGVVIHARLRPDLSPAIVKYVQQVAGGGAPVGAPLPCTDRCKFYRAEPVPEGWGQNGFWGPPYALLQGSLDVPDVTGGSELPREGTPIVERGHLCLIGNGPHFFISLANHAEWGNGHSVFGTVDDVEMANVDTLVALPHSAATWGETHVQTLDTPVNFVLELEPES